LGIVFSLAVAISVAAGTPAPPPVIPADNPETAEKIELGRHLFYDTRLSVNGQYSCATCHQQQNAFADHNSRGIGATGERHARNVPSLANVAYRPVLTWFDPKLRRLEDQLLVPMMGTHPIEMGLSEAQILNVLGEDSDYRRRFGAIFGEAPTMIDMTRAIAAFERTLISFNAPWDRYRAGDEGAISTSAKRGEKLFFSEETQCFRCHPAPHFTDTYVTADLPFPEIAFHDIGLATDITRVRAPSLRNVALTAPYMHDGSLASLSDVIDLYKSGGLAGARDRKEHSAYVRPFTLTATEKDDLIAFLESLTDTDFVTDPRYADPFKADPPGINPPAFNPYAIDPPMQRLYAP
jgi:cytochrome c peroxidase